MACIFYFVIFVCLAMPAGGRGFRQSLKRDKAQCDIAGIDSVTKKWFKKGKISAAEVTEASKEIVQGGTSGNSSGSTDGVGKWANAGGPNEIRGNMSRDVVRS